MVLNIPADSSLTSFTYDRTTFVRYLPHVLCLNEAYVHCDQTRMEISDHLEFIELLSSMGNFVSATVDFEEKDLARELLQKALEAKISVLGQEHPDTLTTMKNLAEVLSSQGKYEDTEEMNGQALALMERVLGKEHPSTLTSMANLAATYRKQRRWREAIELIQIVVNLRTKTIGANHPDTLSAVDILDEWSRS